MSILTTSASEELELPLFQASPDDRNVQRFVALLREHGHLTRKQFEVLAGWSDRDVRVLAEAVFDGVVRGQRGFCLTEHADAEELLRTGEASISQGKKMIRYGMALLRHYHRRG